MRNIKIRKFIFIILFIIVSFAFVSKNVYANEVTYHIENTDFQAKRGEEFTTDVYLTDDAKLADIQMTLLYDQNLLSIVSVD